MSRQHVAWIRDKRREVGPGALAVPLYLVAINLSGFRSRSRLVNLRSRRSTATCMC